MSLSVRAVPPEVPAYSVKNDLLPYLDCGLRYRYQNRGVLPPSRPLQYWPGLFVHGAMEEAFRRWRTKADDSSDQSRSGSALPPVAFSIDEMTSVALGVETRLAARGIIFSEPLALGIGLERVFATITTWGPLLFPTATAVEVRLSATRPLPERSVPSRGDQFMIEGVADLILAANPAALRRLPADPPANIATGDDVIVDYKALRRPPLGSSGDESRTRQDWQVLTYAWLRQQQPSAPPVRLGALLYVNELVPGFGEMDALAQEFATEQIDRSLPLGRHDAEVLRGWRRGIRTQWQALVEKWKDAVSDWWDDGRGRGEPFPRMPLPDPFLSLDYRRMRAARLVPTGPREIAAGLDQFEHVVADIERCVTREVAGESVPTVWTPRPERETCMRCDFRTHCPASNHRGTPTAP